MTSLLARLRRDRRQRDWDARLDPGPLGRLAAATRLAVAGRYAARALGAGMTVLTVACYVAMAAVVGSGILVLIVDGIAGSRQLLVDLGGPTLDSSSAAGDAITVAEGVGTLWLMVTFGGLAVLTVTLARFGERTARREAIAAPQVRTRLRGRVGAVPAAAAVAGVGCILWLARPALHPAVMLLYEYPLVTWIPALAAAPAAALVTVLGRRHGTWTGAGAAFVLWIACLIALPSLQGRALYEATSYDRDAALPRTTQPRLLPKEAAREYARAHGLRHAHLVVDPGTGALVWSAEAKPGLVPRGPSHAIALQSVDRVDGSFERAPVGFDPAVSRTGPGSFAWRTAERHYFTRVEDPAIVPIGRGRAVAVAPYVGYRGFPVRRPHWAGVYVYHQDGTLEDVSPQQALARPELARSGRLYPEKLARDVAEAYGYESGAAAALRGRPRTEIDDPIGNPQPYLTNLGDGRVAWVTTGHPPGHDDSVSAVFLTDAASGATTIWRPPAGRRLLSNDGAAALADGLPLEWTGCCDGDGNTYDIRRVTEPRPVFAKGHFYYLVSIVPVNGFGTTEAVDRTVLVDAERRRIVRVFDHADGEADDALRAFFGRERR